MLLLIPYIEIIIKPFIIPITVFQVSVCKKYSREEHSYKVLLRLTYVRFLFIQVCI